VRLGVPLVEDVEAVALDSVRRLPVAIVAWPYCVGYCDECMVPGGVWVVGEPAAGKIPDDVVRVREWPGCCWSDSGLNCEYG
jgi:hypothetical protein